MQRSSKSAMLRCRADPVLADRVKAAARRDGTLPLSRDTETTMPKQSRTRGLTPFQPGQSGNPKDRPRGARNRATLAVEALLDGEAEALSRKAVELALAGDVTALRLCLERLMPPRKDRPLTIELPSLTAAADVVGASAALVRAAVSGAVTPSEATQLARLLEVHVHAIETHELQARIARLEADAAERCGV